MKVKHIRIELELEEKDNPNHATVIQFENGMWRGFNGDGAIYSRMGQALHIVWQTLRQAVKGD